MSAEEWRPVPGADGVYAVSSLGRVRAEVARLPRKAGELLRTRVGRGYSTVSLSIGGKQRNCLVHRLVAAAFLSPLVAGDVVVHSDGDRTNNALSNLRVGRRTDVRSGGAGGGTDSLPGELWKPVPHAPFDAVYEVSSLGRVRRYAGNSGAAPGILAPQRGPSGYLSVGLRAGRAKSFLIHRLVAEAFLPNPDGLPYVNHKDGVRTNARLDNLEWVSAAENARHAQYVLGVVGVLAPSQVADILAAYRDGATQQHLADKYGVSQNQISQIVLGKSWGAVGADIRSAAALPTAIVPDPGPEVWRPAPDVSGVEVSNYGGLRRAEGGVTLSVSCADGYARRTLKTTTGVRTVRVHRLVAAAFLGAPQPGWQVNHINRVRTDNRVTNLEYIDSHNNTRHGAGYAYRALTAPEPAAEDHCDA